MGKKAKKKKADTLMRIMSQPIAKRLYVSLIPIDNLLGDMRMEIDDGDRAEDDKYFVRVTEIRQQMVDTLDEVLSDDAE